jgi:pilus assembly protein Flp/PilA
MYLKESGQSMVEYALILVLIALVVIVTLTLIGPQVSEVFSQIASSL